MEQETYFGKIAVWELLREMNPSRAEVGNTQNEAGVFSGARNKEMLKKKKVSKGHRSQPERAPNGQSKKKKKMSIKINNDSTGL